ncbi:MAG: 6-bladed beta-propeller [Salinivirgaceae bacterium]|nr:6-bladed beta-propeller [Salinivirgaceae bacterium]
MKTKILSIAAICFAAFAMTACSSGENTANRIEFPGTVDNEAFAACVESISVENLQLEDNWAFMRFMAISLSDNYLYMFDDDNMSLTCFDRRTGEKLSARTIKGNGPGEIVGMNSLFCIGDTLCLYDTKGNILQYDHNCRFLGKMHEFSDLSYRYSIIRLNSGNYVFASTTNPDGEDDNAAMMLADKDFNIISRHFNVPQAQIMIIGGSDPYFVVGDTVRATFYYDCNLYSLCGETEQITELVVPNPITPEKANEIFRSGDFKAINRDYDGGFYTAGGSGRYMMIAYHIGTDNYRAMLDYRKNKVTSMLVSDVEDNFESTAGIVSNLIMRSAPFKSADGYIYARCKIDDMDTLFEGHDNLLDARLKATQAQYHAYLERNAEYIKGLDEDERDEANVVIKIKLKD